MAVTHADLAPTSSSCSRGGGISKTSVVLTVFSILLGLLCFVLCLIAEATRSQIIVPGDGVSSSSSSCRYSGNGKTPLICAAGAFLSLAIGMVVQHAHLLLSVSKSDPDAATAAASQQHHLNTLTWQAAFFFITTWICFSIAEVLLLIGLSVESGHLKGWFKPRHNCFIAREGLFSSAGVLGITTVLLATGLSITAQSLLQLDDQQLLHSSSPPRTRLLMSSTPIVRDDDHGIDLYHQPGLIEYLRAFDKII